MIANLSHTDVWDMSEGRAEGTRRKRTKLLPAQDRLYVDVLATAMHRSSVSIKHYV